MKTKIDRLKEIEESLKNIEHSGKMIEGYREVTDVILKKKDINSLSIYGKLAFEKVLLN